MSVLRLLVLVAAVSFVAWESPASAQSRLRDFIDQNVKPDTSSTPEASSAPEVPSTQEKSASNVGERAIPVPVLELAGGNYGDPLCYGPTGVKRCDEVHNLALSNLHIPLRAFRSRGGFYWMASNPRTMMTYPSVGPICAGPSGAGQCLSVHQYLLWNSQSLPCVGFVPCNPAITPAPMAPAPMPAPPPNYSNGLEQGIDAFIRPRQNNHGYSLDIPGRYPGTVPQTELVEERSWGFCAPPCSRN